MIDSPPALARRQKRLQSRLQNGVVQSFTTLAHPLSVFGPLPRTIGLIELADGTRVTAPLLTDHPAIGMAVAPRMRLSRVNEQGLRIYDVAYEEATNVREPETQHAFPGYILALTGPSGVGKSTVRSLLMRMLGERSALIPLVTTRDRLPGEHGEYRHVTKEKFQQEIAKKNIAALSHFGEGEQKIWEGYRLSDIEAAWAKGMLPVVTTDVHLLRELSNHFGRRSILSFGLLPPGKSKRAMLSALFRRLRERGKETEQWVGARVERAAEELQALRMNAHLFDHLLINEDAGTVAETVERHMRRFESR